MINVVSRPQFCHKSVVSDVGSMSVVLSVVKRTIERNLAAMQKKGVLIREGNTSADHWIVLLKKPEG